MDEDILSTAILRYETESLLGVVPFKDLMRNNRI